MRNLLNFIIEKAYAQDLIPCKDGTMADPTVGCTQAPDAIVNSQSSLLSIILQVADGIITLVVAVATISVIYGAILYTTSLGKDEKLKKAKNLLFWSIVGLATSILAKYIVQAVLEVISQ